MKQFIYSLSFIFIFSIANASFAETTGTLLPADAIGLSALESAEVVAVQHDAMMCTMMMGSDCQGGLITAVTLRYTLKGCVDQISPVTYQVINGNDDRRKILVSAHNIHTNASTYTDCFAPNTQEIHIAIPGHIPAEKISVETMKPAALVHSVHALTPGQHVELLLADNADAIAVLNHENEDGDPKSTFKLSLPYSCGNVLSDINVRPRPLPDNKMVIYVSALEANLKSTAGRCKMLPFADFSVTVPGTYKLEDVKVINLGKFANFGLPY